MDGEALLFLKTGQARIDENFNSLSQCIDLNALSQWFNHRFGPPKCFGDIIIYIQFIQQFSAAGREVIASQVVPSLQYSKPSHKHG